MKPHRNIVVEHTTQTATERCAQLWRDIVTQAVAERDECSVALAGGTTPHALYQTLAETAGSDNMPWERVEIFFGDERDVPADHLDSNYGMAQRALLDHVPVELRRVHPMPADAHNLTAAAEQYEREIREHLPAGPDGRPQFDLVLLGMGGDAHVASLFPFTEAVEEDKRLVVAYFVPILGRHRMTVTFPLINAARNVIMMVTGADKAEAVAEVLGDSPDDPRRLPASAVAPAGTLTIVLDAEAASHLPD